MKNEIKEILDYLKVYATIGEYPMIDEIEDYITNLLEENQELKKQLEHYKTQEIERINKNLLDAKNNYLERCVKANMVGGNNE